MRLVNHVKGHLAGAVPVLTMLGTFGLAAATYYRDDARGGLLGFAAGVPEALAALEPARVAAIHVAVGAEVEPGQLIATLDTSAVDSEILIAEAEKGQLEAALRAQRIVLGRRIDVDRETIEREATREHEDLLRLRAEAQALDQEFERVKKLVAEHQALASDLAQLTLRRAQLASLTIEKPRTIGVLTRQLGAADRQRHEFDDDAFSAARLDSELLVLQRRMELLQKRRSSHLLHATRRGRVASLDKQPGEIAMSGDAVVKLVSTTNRVSVCVPELQSLGLREGDAARLWVRGQRAAPLAGRTVALGPVVSELPARCWRTPRLPMWGREIIVAIDTPIEVVAGEAFVVVLDGSRASPVVPSPALPVAGALAQPVGMR